MEWYDKFKEEVSNLMWFITLPQLISTPISVWIIDRLKPDIIGSEISDALELVDFFVISFPLTVAVALITYLIAQNEANAVNCIMAIVVAAFVSNLLHRFVYAGFPETEIYREFYKVMPDPYKDEWINRPQGIAPWLKLAIRMCMIYWQQFGLEMCLQSLGIGIYAGMRYVKKIIS